MEGDTELSVFRHSAGVHSCLGITEEQEKATTIVSCGGKWTIPAMARVLSGFGIPFRIVHDCDRKGRSPDELANTAAIDPYRANERISQAAGGAAIHVVNDTFEHVLWPEEEDVSGSDKPYRAWRRMQQLVNGDIDNDDIPGMREVFEFAYSWNG